MLHSWQQAIWMRGHNHSGVSPFAQKSRAKLERILSIHLTLGNQNLDGVSQWNTPAFKCPYVNARASLAALMRCATVWLIGFGVYNTRKPDQPGQLRMVTKTKHPTRWRY